ncbi:Gag-Pol polyprotein [Mycena sanguinolenta]|uniref:Gag-Pol polyprotein n=1 Tax=Mycena sanguinolenta TaxID=230812 RepID=A0A8H7CYU5_9AGAR|nr:Gag-Pol polyprotein [Mycena sanguinolenta]
MASSQMISLPVLLATEKLQVSKANFPTFQILIEQHAASKGLKGYLEGTTTLPALTTVPTGTPAPDSTPVFSTAPSREEFLYRDGVMKSMIVTNVVDPIGLGLKLDGTAKECWDSLVAACAKRTDAGLSLAESELQTIRFTGTSRDDLDNLLSNIRNKGNNVRMMGGKADDKDLKNVLIRSLPAEPRWLGLQGALFSAADLNDAFALIKALAINTGMPEHSIAATTPTALNTSIPKRKCTNPGCKAVNKSSHTAENCYWPGGGKEGQFPPNFGRNRPQARQAGTAEDLSVHRVLMATTELVRCVVNNSDAPKAFVSRTFESVESATTVTLLDSGSSDYFFRNRSDFHDYEAIAVRTGEVCAGKRG